VRRAATSTRSLIAARFVNPAHVEKAVRLLGRARVVLVHGAIVRCSSEPILAQLHAGQAIAVDGGIAAGIPAAPNLGEADRIGPAQLRSSAPARAEQQQSRSQHGERRGLRHDRDRGGLEHDRVEARAGQAEALREIARRDRGEELGGARGERS